MRHAALEARRRGMGCEVHEGVPLVLVGLRTALPRARLPLPAAKSTSGAKDLAAQSGNLLKPAALRSQPGYH